MRTCVDCCEDRQRHAPLLEQRAGGEELEGERERVEDEEGPEFDAACWFFGGGEEVSKSYSPLQSETEMRGGRTK